MSGGRDGNILIYRDRLGVRSEVSFLRRMYSGFDRLSPVWLGCHVEAGASALGAPTMRLGNGALDRALFKQFGRVPSRPDLRVLNPRLIHAHFGRGGALALPLARALRVPLAVTFHGGDATKETHYRRHAVPTIYQRRLHALMREAVLFHCVSDHIRDVLAARGFPAEKLRVIRLGIETDPPVAPPAGETSPYLLFVGRFVEKKGAAHLLDAMRLLREAGDATELVLIGDGPLGGELRRDAAALPGIKFLGWQAPAEVRAQDARRARADRAERHRRVGRRGRLADGGARSDGAGRAGDRLAPFRHRRGDRRWRERHAGPAERRARPRRRDAPPHRRARHAGAARRCGARHHGRTVRRQDAIPRARRRIPVPSRSRLGCKRLEGDRAMPELSGKIAIVTGGSRGIGRAVARELAKEGAAVMIASRDANMCEQTVGEIKNGRGVAAFEALDLRQPDAPAKLAAATVKQFGGIDIVVNNAGATQRGDFLSLTDEQFIDGFALKYYCTVRLTRAAWPELKKRHGSIVNVIGAGGRTPGAHFAIGGSVNAACLSFTKAIAELGTADGVQVNAVNPGPVRTDRQIVGIEAAAKKEGITSTR